MKPSRNLFPVSARRGAFVLLGALAALATPCVAQAQTSGGFGGGFGGGSTSGASGGFGAGARDAGVSTSASATGRDGGSSMIQVFPPSAVREEIVGYDPVQQSLTYVERMPSAVGGFFNVSLVTVNARNDRTRVTLTTVVDVDRLRTSRDPGIFREIDARVQRSITDARARLGVGAVLPAAELNAPGVAPRCVSAPYGTRSFSVGDLGTAQLTPSPDERSTRVVFRRNDRSGNALDVPAVSLIEPTTSRPLFAPYTRIADARELPGTDRVALLLRSDVCTPEGTSPAVTGVLVEPPMDQPLPPLEHAELTDVQAMRLLSPRARRRTVDEVEGWYERNGTRVVYDNAWRIRGSYDLLLVQYSRHERSLSPTISMTGHAPAHYALVRTSGSRPQMVFQFAPSVNGSYEGVGQEAFSADLDGDGRQEVLIRVRAQDGSEYVTVLRTSDHDLNFAWSGEVAIDGRRGGVSQCCANNVVRRCSVGLDNRTLVLRCRHETFSGIGPDARLVTSRVRIERLRYNGGSAALEVMER
jgi:hypothetical protein